MKLENVVCIKQAEIFPQCKVSGRSETKSQKILKFPQAKILTFFNFGLFRSLLRRLGTVEKFPKKSVGTLFFWGRQSHDYHRLLRGVNRGCVNLLYINKVSAGIIKARYSMPADRGLKSSIELGKILCLNIALTTFRLLRFACFLQFVQLLF